MQSALQVYLAYDEESSPSNAVSGYAAFTSPGYVQWMSAVYATVTMILSLHLPCPAFPTCSDAHSMFSRRKPPTARVTKKPLFRFDSSRHAISISSYMREQRDLELAGGGEVAVRHYEQDQPSIAQHLVCKPHNRNITGGYGWVGLLGTLCIV